MAYLNLLKKYDQSIFGTEFRDSDSAGIVGDQIGGAAASQARPIV
jgi:hypothetical protein